MALSYATIGLLGAIASVFVFRCVLQGRWELWDLSQSRSGASLAGLSLTEIPLGYGVFCSTYELAVACYLMTGDTAWHEPGRFELYFRRHRLGCRRRARLAGPEGGASA